MISEGRTLSCARQTHTPAHTNTHIHSHTHTYTHAHTHAHTLNSDLNFRGGLRFGKLLEDIDAFAGNIAFMHCNDGDPKTMAPVLVTACLDRLDIKYPVTLNLGTDLELKGQVSWTSNSSVQININLCQKDDNSSNTETKLSASMVFVHVQNGRAAPVNQIKQVTQSDAALFAAGEKANAERKMNRKTSLKSAPPTPEESRLLHTAMLSGFGNEAVGLLSTKMETVQLMQPQERNRAGKIFGGFLMHEAYELAYTTSAAYAASLGATGQVLLYLCV